MSMDGKTIRLRASCNACNESKVRCSQRKPTCARCERNRAECVYGLSRRTHKDAPPISMPPSQRSRAPLRTPPNTDISGSSSNNTNSWGGLSFSESATGTPCTSTPNGGASPDRSMATAMSAHDANTALFGDYMSHLQHYTPQTPTTGDPAHGAGLLMDPLSAAVTQFSTPAAEYANPWAMGPLFGTAGTNDMSAYLAAPPSPPSPSPGGHSCSCHSGVAELLASMRGGGGGGGGDRRLPVDAQLAKLRRCIASSESSMACGHGRGDGEPIHIMAVATLIGYVMDEFEVLACDMASPGALLLPRRMSPAAGDMAAAADEAMAGSVGGGAAGPHVSLAGLAEPRLSWGMLELEDDDEVDLRQRLYLLSFRKLERLLSQLTLYLRNLRDARACLSDPSRHMAFVMACDYTRLWLEKKAEDVKKLLSTPDETLDPSLV